MQNNENLPKTSYFAKIGSKYWQTPKKFAKDFQYNIISKRAKSGDTVGEENWRFSLLEQHPWD